MNRRHLMMTTVALGAAYLLRNDKSRKKLMNQFQSMAAKTRK
ncbi:hypothetical protein RCG24_07110 [Neobacillus sp. OS1-32]|jgi:hypothetical protein|nr:hypothetical protein [Neobacillus sp. OS1-32]WML31619.1 hypothetical protein RCG24_07110 [Neobacillus sp. OS1-32]